MAPNARDRLPVHMSTGGDNVSKTYRSPLRLIIVTIVGIFAAEVVAMIAVYFIEPLPYHLTTLVDAGIMTILIFPVLYYLSFRPLIRQMEKSWQAEESLLQARQLQERFFDSIDTLIAYMDRDFNFIRVNDAYARSSLGETPEFFAGRNHFELFPNAENQAIFKRVVETGEAFSVYEKAFEYPDQPDRGTSYWNWSLHPVKNSDGRVEGLVLSLVEVTERKRAEEQLRKAYENLEQRVEDRTEKLRIANAELEDEISSRNRTEEALRQSEIGLKRAQEIAHLGSWELDLVNNQLTWSDEVYRIFGFQPQEFSPSYEAFLEVVHPDDRAAVDEAYFGSIRDGKDSYEIEHRLIRHSTSEIRVVHEKCEHFRDEEGQIVRSAGMVHDITERKRAEEQLEQSNQKLNEILTSIKDDFYVLNRDWNFVYASRLFTSKVGKEPEDFIGNSIWEMFPKHIGTALEENFRAAMEKREIRRFEIGGKYTSAWYRMTAFPSAEGITVLGTDITEHKQAEEQLRYQAALLSSVNDAIVASDAQFRINAWNSGAESLYGWKAEEVIGCSGLEIVGTEWPDTDANEMRQIIAKTGRWRGEATQRRKDGTRFPVEISSMVLRNDSEQIIGYISVNRDITYRKEAEEALRRSEALLNQTGEMAKVGGWEFDPQTKALVWSMETYRIHEVDPSVQPTVEAAIHFYAPEVRPVITEALAQAIEEGQPYDLELPFSTATGRQLWIRTKGQAEFSDGKCMRLFGTFQDITQRKLAQEELRLARDELELRVQERTQELASANEKLLQEITEREDIERTLRVQTTAMEAAASGIVITDRRGHIQWINPALVQMSGYETRDLIGQSMHIFKSGQHDAAYYRQLWETILAGKVWRGETTNRRKDTSLYIEEQTITPVRDKQGEITQFIAVKQDVTERKKAEKDIWERDQKEKILTQTLHTMQLDIARDLHDTIGQNISFLCMKLNYLSEKPIRKRAEIQTELRSMAQVANESYDLMRGTLAVLQSENSTDLFRLFTRYAEQIEQRSAFKIQLSTQGGPRFMSAKRMRQLFYIFREILNNIEKHAHASQVSIKMTWDSDCLKLLVVDNGSGFNMDSVQYGSHYGLRFMRERVELLNGSILIRSAVGSGTEIILEVPYE